MKIAPIDDGNTNFERVEIREGTPHCKLHGAMNKVSVFPEGGGYRRCVSTISRSNDNCCRAGCSEQPNLLKKWSYPKLILFSIFYYIYYFLFFVCLKKYKRGKVW